jgi:8-oxo-dGTP pyrophosphatase MutT (NUDIX family)
MSTEPAGVSGAAPDSDGRAGPEEFSAGGVVLDGDRVAVIVPIKRGAGGQRVLGLPKGHPDGEETAEQAARREVAEEAGVSGDLIGELGDVVYRYDRTGRPRRKRVRFFLYRYRDGDVADHDHEIEEASWMPLEQALRELTYEGEREMVRRAMSQTIPDR